MGIYLIVRPEEKINWDEYKGAVVVANSPEEALVMLRKEHDPLDALAEWGDWNVTITDIDLSVPAIVLESFNAG